MALTNPPFCSPPFDNSRNINKLAVLDLIRFSTGGISRAEIARQLNISRSAVTPLVNDFLRHEIIQETESGPTSAGRRPILLEVNPKRGYVIGVDLGASHLGVLIADLASRVIEELEVALDINQGPQSCLQLVNSRIEDILRMSAISREDIISIGFGVPGPVISESGPVISTPRMPGWDGFPIRAHLEDHWSRPVCVNNDAELGALGEWAYGAGRAERNLVYIKVGTGVGAGLLIDGRIYAGASGSAGQIGHIIMDPRGPQCACGNQGCLDVVAGGKAIARQALEEVRKGRRTHLSSIDPLESISARDVGAAARMGDLVAQKIVTDAGHNLGIAVAGLVNLINPGMVVVGGGVAQMGDLLLEPIRQTVRRRSLKSASHVVRITTSVLGRRSSSMGAVVQAMTAALHEIVG